MPELVVRDDDGQPETVKYHLLPALLNELQKQQKAIGRQQQTIEQLQRTAESQARTIGRLSGSESEPPGLYHGGLDTSSIASHVETEQSESNKTDRSGPYRALLFNLTK